VADVPAKTEVLGVESHWGANEGDGAGEEKIGVEQEVKKELNDWEIEAKEAKEKSASLHSMKRAEYSWGGVKI
jgi:hypothetical protein